MISDEPAIQADLDPVEVTTGVDHAPDSENLTKEAATPVALIDAWIHGTSMVCSPVLPGSWQLVGDVAAVSVGSRRGLNGPTTAAVAVGEDHRCPSRVSPGSQPRKAAANTPGGSFMRLLITGAGFIGSNLAKLDLAKDIDVTLDQGIAQTVAWFEESR
jgi:hypothetical protein